MVQIAEAKNLFGEEESMGDCPMVLMGGFEFELRLAETLQPVIDFVPESKPTSALVVFSFCVFFQWSADLSEKHHHGGLAVNRDG